MGKSCSSKHFSRKVTGYSRTRRRLFKGLLHFLQPCMGIKCWSHDWIIAKRYIRISWVAETPLAKKNTELRQLFCGLRPSRAPSQSRLCFQMSESTIAWQERGYAIMLKIHLAASKSRKYEGQLIDASSRSSHE